MKKIQLLKRKDFGTILNDTVEFVTKNFGKYSKAFLYFVMPMLLLLMVAMTYLFNSMSGLFSGLSRNPVGFGYSSGMRLLSGSMALAGLAFILISCVSVLQSLLAYEYVLLYDSKDDPAEITIEELWARIKDDFLFMVGSYVGFMVIVFLFVIVNVAIIALIMAASKVLGALLIFGLFFLWIYLMIPLGNFFMIRLRERLGIIDALVRCYHIIKGNWWRTFGIFFLVAILVSILQAICVAPLSILNAVSMIHRIARTPADPGAMFTPLYGITQAVSVAVNIYFSAIICFAGSINYYSLVENTDNTSLLDEIGHIGEKPDPLYTQEGDF